MKKILLYILILFAIHCWRYVGISQTIYNMTDLLSLLFLGYCFINAFQEKGMRFKGPVLFFLFGLVCNILSAYLNNGQSPIDTTLSGGYFYFILIYFFLHDQKFERKDLEQLILVFAILYAIFHLIQDFAFPRMLFKENIYYDRGTVRMRLEGDGFLMLAYFMLLNRFLLKRNILNLILALFFFMILLMSGFRTLTAAAVLLSGFLFLKRLKYSPVNYFLVVLAVLLFLGMMQMDRTSTIINEMITASQTQQEQGDRYIRKVQYKYFTQEYPQNFSYYVVGGGLPGGKGGYAYKIGFMTSQYGFYWVDLGLLGFWLVMGLITMIGLLWYIFKGTFIKLPPEGMYLNLYFAFLFLATNITTNQMYRRGIFGVEAIALYLIDLMRNEYEAKLPSRT